MQTNHEHEEHERHDEEFLNDMERRHREDPAWWKWYEEKRKRDKAKAESEVEGE